MDCEKVKEIIAKFAKMNKEELTDDLDFKKDLHLDSIDMFQIIMEVEDAFKIKLENDELMDIKTVGDALNKVKNAK